MKEVKKESVEKKTTTKAKASTTKKESKTKTTVRKTKKEKAKENLGLLNQKEQKNYSLLCKVINILAKIGRIFLMIFLPFIVLTMVFTPLVFKKYEVSANILKFDNVSIIMRENGISAKIGDSIYSINCDTTEMDHVMTFLTNNSKTSIILHFEFSLLILTTIIILAIYLLNYIECLFVNFVKEKTPFTKENTNYVLKIAVYLFVLKIACLCFSLVGVFTKCFVSINILAILIMFAIYYAFKYATSMQETTDTKLYD